MKKNVIIYCRVSTDKQSKMWESLEVQEQQCREYCKRNDYQVLAVFSEQFTWTKDKRPKVEEALTFIKNSELKIEHIVLKIDRGRWGTIVLKQFPNLE
jgi:DNA invertase Pin-like site-specific DNA recombinase